MDFDVVLSRRHGQAGRRKSGWVRPRTDSRFGRSLDEPRRRPLRFGWNTDRRRYPRNELAGPAWWRWETQVAIEHGVGVRDATAATPCDVDDYGRYNTILQVKTMMAANESDRDRSMDQFSRVRPSMETPIMADPPSFRVHTAIQYRTRCV